MSDAQLGPGWWLASNGKWYPSLDQAPKPGWWVASDGNWYPPKRAPRVASPPDAAVPTTTSAVTELVAPVPPAASNGHNPGEPTSRLPQAGSSRSVSRSWAFTLAVVVGGAVLATASAMPWATASLGPFTVSVAGTNGGGDGWVTLGIGFALVVIGGGLWVFPAFAWRVLAFVFALAGVGLAVFELVHITDETLRITHGSSLLPVQASIGYGLVVLVVGALIAAAGAGGAVVSWRRSDGGW